MLFSTNQTPYASFRARGNDDAFSEHFHHKHNKLVYHFRQQLDMTVRNVQLPLLQYDRNSPFNFPSIHHVTSLELVL